MSNVYDKNGQLKPVNVGTPGHIDHGFIDSRGMKAEDYRRMHTPIVRTNRKIGRNEPCPCRSGKKFKKCHIGKQ